MQFSLTVAIGLFLCVPLTHFADVAEKLEAHFESLVSPSQISQEEIYNGQLAGFAIGGGISIRSPTKSLDPITITMPKATFGCGGINLYTGGFSFVNSKELIETLKAIGSKAEGYAFQLALETVSPQAANAINQLQSWANAINSININSCDMATQLVGAVWPANEAASSSICQSLGANYGRLTDHVAARHQCSIKKPTESYQKFIGDNPNLLGNAYNIVYEAAKKLGRLGQDNDLAQLLMTLMGTLIIEDETITHVYPAKALESDFIDTLLNGGDLSLYACEEINKCLVMTTKNERVTEAAAWAKKIEGLLVSIQHKIIDDQALESNEKALLFKSHLPLLRFITVLTAYKRGACPADLINIAQMVAMDVLVHYLKDSLELVRKSCAWLKSFAAFADKIEAYLTSLKLVEDRINHYESRSKLLMDQEMMILNKILVYESMIMSEIHL